MLAGVLDGMDHALNAALAKAAGDQDAVVAAQACGGGIGGINFLGFDPLQDGFVVVGEAAV